MFRSPVYHLTFYTSPITLNSRYPKTYLLFFLLKLLTVHGQQNEHSRRHANPKGLSYIKIYKSSEWKLHALFVCGRHCLGKEDSAHFVCCTYELPLYSFIFCLCCLILHSSRCQSLGLFTWSFSCDLLISPPLWAWYWYRHKILI